MTDKLIDSLKAFFYQSLGIENDQTDIDANEPSAKKSTGPHLIVSDRIPNNKSFRILDEDEAYALPMESQNILLQLESMGIITASQREDIIQKLTKQALEHATPPPELLKLSIIALLQKSLPKQTLTLLETHLFGQDMRRH